MTIGCHCLAEASESARNLAVVYKTITYGYWIQTKDNVLHDPLTWNGDKNDVNGLAIITENIMCVMALKYSGLSWDGITEYNILPNNQIPSNYPIHSDINDYDGYGNTQKLLTVSESTSYAAGYVNSLIFPNGQKGYLPSFREGMALKNAPANIRSRLSDLGFVYSYGIYLYWSSTYTSISTHGYSVIDRDYGRHGVYDPTSKYHVWPFCKLVL